MGGCDGDDVEGDGDDGDDDVDVMMTVSSSSSVAFFWAQSLGAAGSSSRPSGNVF